MSIQIPTTRKEVDAIRRRLRKAITFACLSREVYIKTLLVAQDMLMRGQEVKAEIVKGFEG